ncbi:MAG TPA: hypothetical protein VFS94_05555 [Gemmatimonadales bacterium]|nr:hypothetical protein [Gemmatimonadales bacterium]
MVALVALIGLVPQYLSRTIPDVAFPLWAAGRVLDGATLYVDILEINPPLFIWLDIPLVTFARWTGLDPILVFRLAVTALLVASVWASYRVLTEGRKDGWTDTIPLLAVTFALFVLPRLDWGEREHLALALMLPWLAVAVRRLEGGEVSRGMALMTGLAAGLGIALKPHFVLVWVGREVAVRLGAGGTRAAPDATRRLGAPSPESLVAAGVCVAYLLAVIVFTPEYFPLVRELAGPYSRFIRATILETMFGPAPAVALTAIVVAVGLRKLVWRPDGVDGQVGSRGSRLAASVTVLFCATAAWSVVALLQLKGFRYHWYPAMALGFLLLCRLAQVARGVHISFTSRLFRAVGTAVVVTTVVLTTWGALRQTAAPLAPEWDADPSIGPLLEALEGRVQPGDTLAVLSPNMASGFPLTNYLGTVWPLRLSNVWPAIVTYTPALELGQSPELRPDSTMSPLERWSLDVLARDFAQARPEWMLMFRHLPAGPTPHMSKLDLAGYLRRNTRIDSAWSAFDSLGVVGLYTLWHRRDDIPRRPIGNVQWPRSSGRGPAATEAVTDRELWIAAFIIALVAVDLITARAAEPASRS